VEAQAVGVHVAVRESLEARPRILHGASLLRRRSLGQLRPRDAFESLPALMEIQQERPGSRYGFR
jgi:hypothetical protein